MLEKDYFLAFKKYFIYIAEKCLKPPAGRGLYEKFGHDILRLSLLKEVDKFGKSKVEDSYYKENFGSLF